MMKKNPRVSKSLENKNKTIKRYLIRNFSLIQTEEVGDKFFLLKCRLLAPFMIPQEEENVAISFHSSITLFPFPWSVEPVCLDFPHLWEFTSPRRNLKSRKLSFLLLQRASKGSFLLCPSFSLPFLFIKQKSQIRFIAALPFSDPHSLLISQTPLLNTALQSSIPAPCPLILPHCLGNQLKYFPVCTSITRNSAKPGWLAQRFVAHPSVGVSIWLHSGWTSFFSSQLPLKPLKAPTCHS